MILDFYSFPDQAHIDCDVCVVGSGAAGITLALELANTSLNIVVLESGGNLKEPDTQALYDSEIVGLNNKGIHQGRQRILGGTTVLWGGQSLPLAKIDFEERSWVPFSGWPISRYILEPFYKRAEAVMNLSRYEYHQDAWQRLKLRPPAFDPTIIDFSVSKFTYKTNFWKVHRDRLREANNLRILQHANVVSLIPNATAKKIDKIEIRTLTGKSGTVNSDVTVLCCGGIESARLLLASNQVCTNGLGNDHDLVGRFFQEHPTCDAAEITTNNPRKLQHLYSLHRRKDAFYFPKIPLAETAQRENKILGVTSNIFFRLDQDSGLAATKRWFLGRRNGEKNFTKLAHQFLSVAKDMPDLTYNIYQYFILKHYPVSYRSRIFLRCYCEQSPNPSSRITLSREKDRLGMPKSKLEWLLTDDIHKSVRTHTALLSREFRRLGLGYIQPLDWLTNKTNTWTENFWDAYHHMGTTRMADDPKKGVVDRNCKMHGINNLYVVSSSVFPTSGTSNPTLTIIALAIRLADRLKSTMI